MLPSKIVGLTFNKPFPIKELRRTIYLGLVAVDYLQNCSLEHFLRLLIYMNTVAVMRPEYCSQGQLQDPSVSVDRQEVSQREVSLFRGDISVLRPVQITAPAPTKDTFRDGPGVDPLVGQITVCLFQC